MRNVLKLHRPLSVLVALLLAAPILAQPSEAAPELHGHLRTIDGVEVLFLRGDLEQRSFTEGYLVADRIRALFVDFALSKRVVPSPMLWNHLVIPGVRAMVQVPQWVRTRSAALLRGMKARDPKSLRVDELGRELTVDDLVAASTIPDLVGLACSSFVAWGDRTSDQGPVVGRNLDYYATPALLRMTMVVVHAPRDDRAGWVAVGWPGLCGLLTGISERHVAVAIHDVPAKAIKGGAKVTPRPIALQELIERLDPRDDPAGAAAAILREHRFGMGGNAMVGWRASTDHGVEPGGAVFELFPAETNEAGVTVRMPAAGESFVTCSNHHRQRVEPPQKPCWRYTALHDGTASAGERSLDVDSGWELLGRAKVDGTLYQVVADLATDTFGVRLRRVPKKDEWSEVRGFHVVALIAEAERGPTAATEPVRAGAGAR
jgi:hypothetical protein